MLGAVDSRIEMLMIHSHRCCQGEVAVKMTPNRQLVLQLLQTSGKPLSAYEVLDRLRAQGTQWQPPTVYRALDFLLEQGFVHKVESTNSYVLCHLFDQPTHTSAMFICDRCGVVKEECAEGVEDIMHTLAARMGFALRHNVIEAHGLCSACVEVESCRHQDACQHDHSILVKKKPR